jgi:putative endonuclease
MFSVYVLRNKEGKLYKGYSSDLERRLKGHASGKNTWTRVNGPWKLVYREEFATKKEAIKRERFLKTGKGREFLKKLLKEPNSASA